LSRPLVTTALALYALAGLAPIVAMALRVEATDLEALLEPRTVGLLGRTVLLGAGASGVAVLLGAPLGFLVSRTDLPAAAFWRPLALVPLVLPPLFLAITWTAVVELRGAPAAIGVLGLHTFPIVAFFTAAAFDRIDAPRQEAAQLVGGLPAVLRMELPLVLPAVLCGACLAFLFAVNDFATPDYISSVGRKFNVYADEVFANYQLQESTGRAVASSLPLVLLSLAMLVPALLLRRRGALATVGGTFRRPVPLRLGAWRLPALAFVLVVLVLACGLPVGRLLYEAGVPGREAVQGPGNLAMGLASPGQVPVGAWSLPSLFDAFRTALERTRQDLGNSLLYSTVAGLVAVPLALALAHLCERTRGGRLLEVLLALPMAVPAILFGIGNIAVWNHGWSADFFDSGALVVVLEVGRFLIFPLLLLTGAVASLSPRLEEAARLAGVPPARRLVRVVAPAVLPSLLAGWSLVFVLAMRELDAAILVPAANHTIIFRVFNQIHFGRDDAVAALCLLVVFFLLLPGLLWSLFLRRRVEVMP
jgi:iron(III) transport system permease protein